MYKAAFERLVDLHNRHTDLTLRKQLLEQLNKTAPAWAAAIRERHGPHGKGEVPGDAGAAWIWRQLHDELEKRGKISLSSLQQKIEQLSTELRNITNELIRFKAWGAQLQRTTLSQQQALVGYLHIMKKIGAGTGKMVPRLRAEARQKTGECRDAVPVWIMPLTRVAENFDPRNARFDVAIIDEASQCDVMGLLAFYLAKQVVIVGDHEQVSPVAVGQKLDVVQHLIDEHLQGIPNNVLYDGQRSVYDIAQESFGGTIRLVEHFRCVPEIIQFSNKISYNGAIQALRDPSGISLKPHVISYRVEGAFTENKVNKKEALTVASLLVAATKQPEYKDKTFGVVTLLGNEGGQATEIDRLLRLHLPEDEYTKRRIVSGNSAHFQGDERDVMFLSVVDAPGEKGPLSMRGPGNQDMWKKRFNVAASRAGDQMWVVHSLDPRTDLKPGDLRRMLIEHAEDPQATIRELEKAEEKTESVFEKEVMQRLIAAGYKVVPQWKVGHYRIDLVVEGNGQRLAVECDGDRYHPIEKLEEDMGRQAILERLGWTFVRIRGSQFFRNPDTAIEPVLERIHQLGITPDSQDSGSEHGIDDVEQKLKEKVIRLAAKLRRQWLGKEESEEKSKEEPFENPLDTPVYPIAQYQNQLTATKEPGLKKQKNVQDTIAWARTIDGSTWFEMSHWAKANGYLQPWDNGLLLSLGEIANSEGTPTYKQAKNGKRIYNKLIELGFSQDSEQCSKSSNHNENKLIAQAPKPLREVFSALELYIMLLGSDVKKKELQRYYAFKCRKNFACIVINSSKLTVYLNVNPSRVDLEQGFARDVSDINHLGTGDLELTIKSLKDLEKAKPLIYLSYRGYKSC